MGTISPSWTYADGSGNATATLSTGLDGPSGTAQVAVKNNQGQTLAQTQVQFTRGSWLKTFSGNGSGTVTWATSGGAVDAYVNDTELSYSGQQITIQETYADTYVYITGGTSVDADGNASSQLSLI